ncbi:hypothetical protein N431DRAFT_499203 [Stipitochalara longipes BDJ]|nr:hypothetical protein N431DRAFT_499203 [Stipitochalara longipes BDJ]
MWLINTESLELENFIGDDIPGYAILSHTWGDEEVTFQDWQDPEKRSQKAGFAKIDSACAQAQADSLNYIWVDTNCINKFSSAELSEAINSMFAWYKNSYTCYVWFTRGWTLQELLAPRSIRFFTKEWKPISMELERYHSIHSRLPEHDMHPKGLKRDNRQEPLLRLLSDITGIRLDVLSYPENAVSCSNAEKMSWIADRETTREEDIAYCLLGIFDINMPLLYGEGSKAFRRLQEEIIKQSTDHSLFAWHILQSALSPGPHFSTNTAQANCVSNTHSPNRTLLLRPR